VVRVLPQTTNFSLIQNARIGSEAYPDSYQMRKGGLLPQGIYTVPSLPTSAEVTNEWSHTSPLPMYLPA
jgi:hypothetical protein